MVNMIVQNSRLVQKGANCDKKKKLTMNGNHEASQRDEMVETCPVTEYESGEELNAIQMRAGAGENEVLTKTQSVHNTGETCMLCDKRAACASTVTGNTGVYATIRKSIHSLLNSKEAQDVSASSFELDDRTYKDIVLRKAHTETEKQQSEEQILINISEYNELKREIKGLKTVQQQLCNSFGALSEKCEAYKKEVNRARIEVKCAVAPQKSTAPKSSALISDGWHSAITHF